MHGTTLLLSCGAFDLVTLLRSIHIGRFTLFSFCHLQCDIFSVATMLQLISIENVPVIVMSMKYPFTTQPPGENAETDNVSPPPTTPARGLPADYACSGVFPPTTPARETCLSDIFVVFRI